MKNNYKGVEITGGWVYVIYDKKEHGAAHCILYNKKQDKYVRVTRQTFISLMKDETNINAVLNRRKARAYWHNGKTSLYCTKDGEPIPTIVEPKKNRWWY